MYPRRPSFEHRLSEVVHDPRDAPRHDVRSHPRIEGGITIVIRSRCKEARRSTGSLHIGTGPREDISIRCRSSSERGCVMSCSPSDRLRWIAEYLDLAGRALSIIACVHGVDCPLDLNDDAQADLLALADQFDREAEASTNSVVAQSSLGLLLQAKSTLRRSAEVVGLMCETTHPPMELLEVHHSIQCALSRLQEWDGHAHCPSVNLYGIDGLHVLSSDHREPLDLSVQVGNANTPNLDRCVPVAS